MRSGEGIPLLDGDYEFCIESMAHYSWWHDKRFDLKVDRGPWPTSHDLFHAVRERELKWTKSYAKPRLPDERLYREIYHFCQVSPDVLRHTDFQPNNILISKTNEIVGLVDWQHLPILPLGIAAGIPKHFQNYGDPDSEKLLEPQIDLPPNFDSLSFSEQVQVRETIRKRLVHFLYAALTKRSNQEHYDAIFNQSVTLHQRLFKSAGTPWEGDSTTLRAEMIHAIQSWSTLITADSIEGEEGISTVPPLEFTETSIRDTMHVDAQQREADPTMEQMRAALGVHIMGWVANDNYQAAKQMAREVKAKMLEAAQTPAEVTGVQNHFPFDDFDEDS
ncbi:hypothetical protein BJY04DRAFT_221806 [Aspergillus karnatakaensis]|uniref:uncharacterized protein n=1 Tax=Aspergillus karnatakaensis TaxID=1810916 RepID=UPI003CCE4B47